MIKLEFTEQQITLINSALIELPFRVVAPLIDDINKQIQESKSTEDKRAD